MKWNVTTAWNECVWEWHNNETHLCLSRSFIIWSYQIKSIVPAEATCDSQVSEEKIHRQTHTQNYRNEFDSIARAIKRDQHPWSKYPHRNASIEYAVPMSHFVERCKYVYGFACVWLLFFFKPKWNISVLDLFVRLHVILHPRHNLPLYEYDFKVDTLQHFRIYIVCIMVIFFVFSCLLVVVLLLLWNTRNKS